MKRIRRRTGRKKKRQGLLSASEISPV